MNKLIRKKWLKVVSFLLAAVSLPVTVSAAIIFGICVDRDYIAVNEHDIGFKESSFKEKEIERLAEEYRHNVLDGAYKCLVGGFEGEYSDYMNEYTQENSNYYFSIVPKDGKWPKVSNYYNDDYQYKSTETYVKDYYIDNVEDTYPYSLDKMLEGYIEFYNKKSGNEYILTEDGTIINNAKSKENESQNNDINKETTVYEVITEDGYEEITDVYADIDGDKEEIIYNTKEELLQNMYIDLFSDNCLTVRGGFTWSYDYVVDLDADSGFAEHKKMLEKSYSDENAILEVQYSYYDIENECIVINYALRTEIELEYTEYVKSDLTAYDRFYYSPFIRYGDIIEKWTIPLLISAGLIFIISSVILCITAGRKPEQEEVVIGRADKIPLEVWILFTAALTVLLVWMIDEAFDRILLMGVIGGILSAAVISVLYPVLLSTVAVRIKTHTILKNTIIYKVLRKMFKIGKKSGSYMWNNIHIYGKVLIIYLAVVLLEMFFIGRFSYHIGEISWASIWLTDIVVAAVIVISLINMNKLKKGAIEIAKGNPDYKINTSHMLSEFRQHGETLNNINDGIQAAVEQRLKSERMKTELITNVSHDIKTPITSIISYVDLLDKENIENETAKEYIEVLKRQSEKLKKLVQDLIDASKASTGNMPVNFEPVNVNVMLEQILGESVEKLESRSIKPVVKNGSDNAVARADGRLLWRVFDNLIQNVYKYAMENSRVYIDVEESVNKITVTLKNISKNELNVSGDELMERFVRGDSSRNTEGSGLGLSIAGSLMKIQGGSLNIVVDGDLFKAVVEMGREL